MKPCRKARALDREEILQKFIEDSALQRASRCFCVYSFMGTGTALLSSRPCDSERLSSIFAARPPKQQCSLSQFPNVVHLHIAAPDACALLYPSEAYMTKFQSGGLLIFFFTLLFSSRFFFLYSSICFLRRLRKS